MYLACTRINMRGEHMKKIYIVSWYGMSDAGGVERVTQYMYEAWKNSYEVHVLDLEAAKENRIYKILLGKHYVLDSLIMSLYAGKLKRSNKNSILVTQGYNAPFLYADIEYIHGTMRGYKVALEGENTKWHFNQIFEKIATHNAKKIVAVSQHAKAEVHELYNVENNKIAVIENCVDTSKFECHRDHISKKINILFAGRLEHGKGIGRLLKLANEIENEKDMNLLIASPETENINLFQKLTRTVVYSHLSMEEMKHFYQKGDLMFFPSLYEGFGMVTLESLSSGVPVLGNDVGAIGDLYRRKMEGVYLLGDESDDLKLIRQIAQEFNDVEKRKKLHESVETEYGEQQYYKKLRDILGEM